MSSWSELSLRERIEVALRAQNKRIEQLYPDGIPMDLYKTNFTAYIQLGEIQLSITMLESILR